MSDTQQEVDIARFGRMTNLLAPDVMRGYLETIASLGEGIVQEMQRPDALTCGADGLAFNVHKLAGAASNFGFHRITDSCRRFESAVASIDATSGDAPSGNGGVAALAACVSAAIEAALPFVRSHIAPSSSTDTAARQTTGLPEGLAVADLPLSGLLQHGED